MDGVIQETVYHIISTASFGIVFVEEMNQSNLSYDVMLLHLRRQREVDRSKKQSQQTRLNIIIENKKNNDNRNK